ncbi:MAG: ADP-ribosylation factor-like protein [Promethearchaeota archaeon]
MVKIPGTQWDLEVVGKDSDYTIEVTRVGKKEATLRVRDVAEIEDEVLDFLKSRGQDVPTNRLRGVVEHLEEQAFHWDEEEKKEGSKEKLESLMKSTGSGNLKILLMGLSGAGKTSIYRTIFEEKEFWEIRDLPPTRGIQRMSPDTFLGGTKDQKLYIWDVGGQRMYRDRYHDDPYSLFGSANGLIFVIDAVDPSHLEEARRELAWCVTNLESINPSCKVFCFLHKVDLSPDRQHVVEDLKEYVLEALDRPVTIFGTSVFDNSIYLAWGNAMEQILPKSKVLNVLAQDLKNTLHVYNVLVLEKRTGLPLCSSKVYEEDEDIKVTGLLNRLMVTIEKVANELDLLNVEKITVQLGNGVIYIREIFENVLLLITAPSERFMGQKDNIQGFARKIREYL